MALISFMLFILAIMVSLAILFNGQINRKYEMQQKRLAHRLIMLEKFISFYGKAQEYNSLDGFYEVQRLFNLYGEEDEINQMDYITTLIKNNPKNSDLPKRLNELCTIVTEKLKEELTNPSLNWHK